MLSVGFKFCSVFVDYVFEVNSIDNGNNILTVGIYSDNDYWTEDWNLEHTFNKINNGEYFKSLRRDYENRNVCIFWRPNNSWAY